MNLESCEYCGVVLAINRVKLPDWTDGEGAISSDNAEWDGDRYVPLFECPVCHNKNRYYERGTR